MNDDIGRRHHQKIIQRFWMEETTETLAFVIVDEDFRGETVDPLADAEEIPVAPDGPRVTVA